MYWNFYFPRPIGTYLFMQRLNLNNILCRHSKYITYLIDIFDFNNIFHYKII